MAEIDERTYSELAKLQGFENRYEYLRLSGTVGEKTFGFDRYLNQILYTSTRWRQIRHHVIVRDDGCDLGILDYEIQDRVIVHHMNPVTIKDIEYFDERLLDPEFLICVSHRTHLAIHYGNKDLLPEILVDRRPGDTIPWR